MAVDAALGGTDVSITAPMASKTAAAYATALWLVDCSENQTGFRVRVNEIA